MSALSAVTRSDASNAHFPMEEAEHLNLPPGTLKISGESTKENQATAAHEAIQLRQAIRHVQRLGPIRKDAVLALIIAREKMRDYSHEREMVSTSIADFMAELHALEAQGKIAGIEKLTLLYHDILSLRDLMGPAERVCIDAEQAWESKAMKLSRQEEVLYQVLNLESVDVDNAASEAEGSISGLPSSNSEYDSFRFDDDDMADEDDFNLTSPSPIIQDSAPNPAQEPFSFGAFPIGAHEATLNLGENDMSDLEWDDTLSLYYSDIQAPHAIDRELDQQPYGFSIPVHDASDENQSGADLNSDLLLDFATARERINKWLMHTALQSRNEAILLKQRLFMEHPQSPSAWAQLVVAWWDRDRAAAPKAGQHEPEQQQQSSEVSTIEASVPKMSSQTGEPRQSAVQQSRSCGTASQSSAQTSASEQMSQSERVSSRTTLSTIQGGPQQFVAMLYDENNLRELFSNLQHTISRDEFRPSFDQILGVFAIQFVGEALTASQLELNAGMYFVNFRKHLTKAMEAKLFDSVSTLPVNRTPPNKVKNTMDYIQGLQADKPVAFSEYTDVTENSFDLPDDVPADLDNDMLEKVRDFIVRTCAFQNFCKALELLYSPDDPTIVADLSSHLSTILPALDTHYSTQPVSGKDMSRTSKSMSGDLTPKPMTNELSGRSSTELLVLPAIGSLRQNSKEVPCANTNSLIEPDSSTRRPVASTSTQTPDTFLPLYNHRASEPIVDLDHVRTSAQQSDMEAIAEPRSSWTFGSVTAMSPPENVGSSMMKHATSPVREKSNFDDLVERGSIDSITETRSHEPLTSTLFTSSLTGNSREASMLGESTGRTSATTPSDVNLGRYSNHENFTKHDRSEFEWGKVFKIRSSESLKDGSSITSAIRDHHSQVSDDVLQFVIVGVEDEECVCLSIVTFGPREVAGPAENTDKYAIIYKQDQGPPVERTFPGRPAIEMIPYVPLSSQPSLTKELRLDYSQLYEFAYSIKIWFIGRIVPTSEDKVKSALNSIHPAKPSNTQAPTSPRASYAQVVKASGGQIPNTPPSTVIPKTTKKSTWETSGLRSMVPWSRKSTKPAPNLPRNLRSGKNAPVSYGSNKKSKPSPWPPTPAHPSPGDAYGAAW